jgi:hypothetical protein
VLVEGIVVGIEARRRALRLNILIVDGTLRLGLLARAVAGARRVRLLGRRQLLVFVNASAHKWVSLLLTV